METSGQYRPVQQRTVRILPVEGVVPPTRSARSHLRWRAPPPPLEGAISHSDSVFGGANLNPRVRSLVLWGPSRTGKTLYARSLGRHAYFNLQFNLDALSDTAEYAVFDDIQGGFEFFPAYKGWLGAQKEFTVTDKYRKKKTVHWGKPSIMLMNDDPCTCKGVDYAWLKLNCFIIHVDRQFCYVID